MKTRYMKAREMQFLKKRADMGYGFFYSGIYVNGQYGV